MYLIFLSKCRWEKAQIKPGSRDKEWLISNNGELEFTYAEAQNQYGFTEGKFLRAIDDLLRVGLIDIAKSGFGLRKDKTLYSISTRWRKYGTDEFKREERSKRDITLGFSKGNRHGRKRG